MEIRMKKKFIICGLLVAGILTIVISMYQKDKTSEAEHEEWIKIQYSNQNGAFFNRSAWIDYHNAELLNETKVWVDLYVYNQYVSKEEKIFLEDVKKSTLVSYSKYQQRSLIIRIKEAFARLISPIL